MSWVLLLIVLLLWLRDRRQLQRMREERERLPFTKHEKL